MTTYITVLGYSLASLGVVTLLGSWFRSEPNERLERAWKSFLELATVAFFVASFLG